MNNILFLISSDKARGGAEEVLRIIATHYLDKRDEVYIFFLLEKKEGFWEKIKANRNNLHLYYSKGGGKFGIFSILRNFISVRKIKFKYVYSSIVECTGLLGILRRVGIVHTDYQIGRESTLIFSRFKGLQLWVNKIMYRFGYPAVDVVICQTQLMKDELLRNVAFITKRSKVVVIPNPVDFNRINQLEKEAVDVSTYGEYIVSAGRFVEVKGFDILINAFAILKKTYTQLHLVILGDGGLKDSLNIQVEKAGLVGQVFFPGMVTNVYPYFHSAKLCVVSSRIEGFPNVLLQMMSQNEKVVSTTCAGDIDRIKGLYTCEPNDSQLLYEALHKCLESNTSQNRFLFDEELKKRDVNKFIEKVESVCQQKCATKL